MPIQVTCPSCKGMFNAPDNAAGKKAKCPKCGGVIEIPTPAAAEEVFDAEEAAPRPFDEDEYEVEPPPEPPAQAEERRPCPMCGEMISRDAVKCRFCGEIFDEALRAAERRKTVAPEDEDLSAFEWVIAILCSGIGCIVGIVYMIQGKPKGKKMFLISFCMQIFWGIVRAAIQMAAQ